VSDASTTNAPRRARGRPRGWDDKTGQNTIKSLDRAMEVFDHLSTTLGQTLSEIAADLRQSPATVYRILITLERRRLVEFERAEQLWHIGPHAFVIGSRFLRRTSLVERARPILRRLMEDTGETANLGIVQGGSVLFVSQVETHANIRAFFPPGSLSPLHSSGIGKALLADMSEERLNRMISHGPLETFTPNTLATKSALVADLAMTRQRGYAIDNEEKNLGMRCIASSVFDMHEEAVAGISISGPSIRMEPDQIARLSRFVVDAAADLTAALGGTPRQERPSA